MWQNSTVLTNQSLSFSRQLINKWSVVTVHGIGRGQRNSRTEMENNYKYLHCDTSSTVGNPAELCRALNNLIPLFSLSVLFI
jgi:hypothetical protein